MIARDRRDRKSKTKTKNLPLINTDDTDQEEPKPLKRGGTEAAEKIQELNHKVEKPIFMRLRGPKALDDKDTKERKGKTYH